jgi:putative multicomponent Na+:H+ antiporter subunit B
MMELVLNINLVLLIIISIAIVMTGTLRRAVILSGVLSIGAAFSYMFLAAPDVALAEAVIGSTISTVVLLVGIKKSKLFTVYYIKTKDSVKNEIFKAVEKNLLPKELDPQFICTGKDKMYVKEHHDFEMLIREVDDKIEIYGEKSNSIFCEVLESIEEEIGKENIILKDIYNMKED